MLRPVSMLLCAAVASAAFAAPAPVSKPKPSNVWVDGWDKPVDQVGDCGFTPVGDKLTIAMPPRKGGRWIMGVFNGATSGTAPHMLRDVRGDFSVQVRMTGDFTGASGRHRAAGLLLKAGQHTILLQRQWATPRGSGKPCHGVLSQLWEPLGPASWGAASREISVGPQDRTTYLRLERRGDRLVTKWSPDGAEWTVLTDRVIPKLPERLKLGVFAHGTDTTLFEPVFDQFKLTPLK